MKKYINTAELDFIRLGANDTICTSGGKFVIGDEEGKLQFAPDRDFGGSDFNYRGVEKGFDEDEW